MFVLCGMINCLKKYATLDTIITFLFLLSRQHLAEEQMLWVQILLTLIHIRNLITQN